MSVMLHPTADWQPLYDVSYKMVPVFPMLWEADLSNARGAKFGGPIAVAREDEARPSIRIFGGGGRQLSTISLEGRVAGFGWTHREHLAVVQEDGTTGVYNMHGDKLAAFDLGEAVQKERVAEVEVWGEGLVVLTKRNQFWSVDNLDDPYPEPLEDAQLRGAPTCWAVIPPHFTGHGGVEVLVGSAQGSIIVLEADRASDQQLSNGPFLRVSVSPNGKMIAMFSASGALSVISSDFSQNYTEFHTRNKVPPEQLAWCGSDAITMRWSSPSPIVLLVGPYGDWLKYGYESDVLLVSEQDGVRVVGKECQFLQRVPSVTEDIFKIASTSSAAKLYDALEHFNKKSPRADDLIRSLREAKELENAVEAIIEAAALEWNETLQQNLLQAAAFGKCFLSGYDPSSFLRVARELRVLNAVRDARVGICLSYRQLQDLSAPVLIDRLIARNEHFLAWKISNWLQIKGHRVLIQWACSKVKGLGEEHEITQSIVQKLQGAPGISYAEIASTAYKSGRPELAKRLLDYEPRAVDQVPLLINMFQPEAALQKALDSGDADLVYLVLLHLRRKSEPAEFLGLVKNRPQAAHLMLKYAWFQDKALLKDIAPDRQGDYLCWKAGRVKDNERRAQLLSTAHEAYASRSFEKEVVGTEVKLIRWQMDLEDSGLQGYVGLSVAETLAKLFEEDEKADKFAKDFKVSDTCFWWTKIRVLVKLGRYEDLSKFAAGHKKSPIGWAPFIDVLVDAGAPNEEAVQYVSRIPERHIQAGYFMQLNQYKEAADAAAELGDPNALQQILQKCETAADKRHVQQLLAQF